jgi:hypothetical protein
MPTTSVNNRFDTYFECIKEDVCRHLLSQNAFEMLVPFFVRSMQGVKYDSLSILWIDHKYNPVAHDAQAAPLKQYGSQILGYEKR